jgi:hypothetical protein
MCPVSLMHIRIQLHAKKNKFIALTYRFGRPVARILQRTKTYNQDLGAKNQNNLEQKDFKKNKREKF